MTARAARVARRAWASADVRAAVLGVVLYIGAACVCLAPVAVIGAAR